MPPGHSIDMPDPMSQEPQASLVSFARIQQFQRTGSSIARILEGSSPAATCAA